MVVLPLLIFLSVSCGIAGLVLWLVPGKTQQRLQRLTPRAGKTEWIETVAGIVGPFAKLSAPEKDWETSPLKTRFLNAGIRHRHAQAIYFGAKTLLPVVFAVLMYLAVRTSQQLGGALGRLMAVAEAYPDLKANTTMMQLSEELTSTENKVAFARQAYNDAVMTYNNDRETFPSSIAANMFGFQPAQPLDIAKPEAREAPKVSFT